ncbi:fucolectin-like [Pantherophis guttatus]|uniref:Fucolectin-like n=1 Tax=Pantherophis guttatus TaxID=94885 RepID=A0ABM3YPZ7_PANGU|nr:fucolectin-like [Pantherophis guttatus]
MPIFLRNCSLKRSSCEIHPHLVDQVRYPRTMLITWMWLPLLGLLAGHGEAQRCKPEMRATNVARGRPAFQSSTYVSAFNSVASKAVDGNCSGRWVGQNSCTHTQREMGPWWYVDLGSRYAVSSVVVKSREDCCGERLRGAEIRVGNFVTNHGKSNPLCGTITNTRLGAISTISCNGKVGRYVTVTVPRMVSLALCEVEVYGTR